MGKIISIGQKAAVGKPLIFISGPVRGADLWKEEFSRIMARRTKEHDVSYSDFSSKERVHGDFRSVLDWGFHHMDQALETGGVLFWFSKRTVRIPANDSRHHDHEYAGNDMFDLCACLDYGRAAKGKKKPIIVIGYDHEYHRKTSLVDRVGLRYPKAHLLEGTLRDTYNKMAELLGY